jgi:hypothetical protein
VPSASAETLLISGVTFQADSSARVTRAANSTIQAPGLPLNPTQGWVAFRMKMGFASTTTLSPDPVLWDLSESDPNDLFLYYDVDSDTFHLPRRVNRRGPTVASARQTFTAGSLKTVIAAWTTAHVKISVDGTAFVSLSSPSGSIPAPAPFLIGSSLVQGARRQPDSDYYWVAAGTGTLTDADAAAIHGFGSTDKTRSDFPGTAVFMWKAESAAFNDDADGLRGDVNGDTSVNVADLRELLKILTGQAAPVLERADLTGDAKVSLGDVRELMRILSN